MTQTIHGRRARKEKKVLVPKECFSIVLRTLMAFLPIRMQGRFKTKDILFAIDETDDPYYGKACPQNDGYVIGGRAKKSSGQVLSVLSVHAIP